LSAPRATILGASSAHRLCSALASSHGARIQTSRLFLRGQDYRHRLGMDRRDDAVRLGGKRPAMANSGRPAIERETTPTSFLLVTD